MKKLPEIEFASKTEIEKLQNTKLRELIKHLSSYSVFYKNHFRKNKIDVDKISSVDDLKKIPATTKDDLQKHNHDFFCAPRNKIIEYCTTSGTLGNPVTVALTENDLQRLAYNEYISFVCADGKQDDVYQFMLSLDRQFMAGMAYHIGVRKLGAGIIRVGPGNPSMQFEIMSRFNPTALIAVPSFLIKLIEYAEEKNIDLNKLSVKKVVCIGENIRDEKLQWNVLGEKIISKWNLNLFSTYASTEMQTAFTECVHGCGGHHHPELLIAEILNDDDKNLPQGEYGELTITTLGVEGTPLLRYKTGDICCLYDDVCKCGRTSMRISPVRGRKKQMIKYNGTTLYPQSIFEILNRIDAIQDYVVEATTNNLGNDDLHFYLSVHNINEKMMQRINHKIQAALRVVPAISFQTLDEIQHRQIKPAARKPSKFIDSRKG